MIAKSTEINTKRTLETTKTPRILTIHIEQGPNLDEHQKTRTRQIALGCRITG